MNLSVASWSENLAFSTRGLVVERMAPTPGACCCCPTELAEWIVECADAGTGSCTCSCTTCAAVSE